MNKDQQQPLMAHLSMFMACAFWGLMAPIGKDAMMHGIDSFSMVSLRVLGGAMLFWITSFFVPKEHVPRKDVLLFAGAAVFGLVCNQCCFTIGLGITSPINASIMTTSMPIFAMVLSFLILREPLSFQKVFGVLTGCCGAVILILTSMSAVDAKVGDIRGDLLCLTAQFSFALYLSLFSKLVRKYTVFTVNKWMFTWAALFLSPVAATHLPQVEWAVVPAKSLWEAGYVVFFGTYVCYLLTMIGQKTLRPTVVSIYNYVQPMVAVVVSVLTGMGVFKWSQGLATLLVFAGVWMVTKSKSRRDMEKAAA